MLVCSCNVITDKDIEAIVIKLLDEDCWRLIVPGTVYNALEKSGRCCGCFPNVVETIIRVTEEYHLRHNQMDENVIQFMDRVRSLRDKFGSSWNERRTKGHRAA
ncbi:bacterioferritin-associated ferredoxin [Daeguia caeni]|uniref:Bacterioferritin-associated ferredoxin n=1 Tax=Daeguia caeni TaxID=439612 RepID=A0ABV9HA60_9HYPH